MKRFNVVFDKDFHLDIQEAIGWYDEQSAGLGTQFYNEVALQITDLESNPYSFRIRYSDVRCMLIRNFPFLLHFIINESSNQVEVFALIHTSRNPRIWKQRYRAFTKKE